ncbi:hypothetical protein BH23ACT12_BH23ACT12_16860 [soil metagenome]
MPVIRKDPAAVPSSPTQAASSPAAQSGRPAPYESQSHSGSSRTPISPPTDAIALAAKALEEVKTALAEQHLRTQTRLVRGLEALDHREIERQRATHESFEAAIREVVVKMDDLKHEMRLVDRSARRQIDELSGRLDSALDGMVEILGHMKSEIAAIHYSLDASRTEARMQSQSSRAPEEQTL